MESTNGRDADGDAVGRALASLRRPAAPEPPPASGSGWARAVAALAVAAIAGGVVLGVRRHGDTARVADGQASGAGNVAPSSAVAPPRAGTISCSGFVEDDEHARIAAAVMARVAAVHVREGDPVSAGALLVELDATELGAMRTAALARAGAANARASVARYSRAEAELATERERRLVTLGATPRATVDDGDARLRVLGGSINAANADAIAANAEVGVLDARLALHRLVAPFAGTVVTRPPAVGDVALAGVPLFELAGALLVAADVPESRLASVEPGATAEVRLDAVPEPLAAKVVGFAPRVDKAKATATVKLRIDRTDVPLRVGMAARVRIDAKETHGATKESGR